MESLLERERTALAAPRVALGLGRRDLFAVLLVLAGYGLAVLLMPLTRSFAYDDDWTFTRSVERIVDGRGFAPSELGQMSLATHAYWGALFAKLFGMSFTTLNIATMAMSIIAALTFYVLLRRVGFNPGLSGLGVTMLIVNPYYLKLTYSFMTEITFAAMLLLSTLFYFEGLHEERDGWLWVGSAFAALAFLTRQFGLAVPLAAIVWLLYTHNLSRRRLLAVALVPLAATIGYYAWSVGFGPTVSGSVGRNEILGLLYDPSAWFQRLKSFSFAAPLAGLTLLGFHKVRHWKMAVPLALAWAAAVYIQGNRRLFFTQDGAKMAQPFDTVQPFKLEFTPIWWVAAALTVWLVAGLVERGWPYAVPLLKRRQVLTPVHFVYLVGITLLVGTFVARMEFFTRYMLPILPFIITVGLASLKGRSVRSLAPVLGGLALVATCSLALHLDEYEFLSMRWDAGHALVAQGVPYTKINNGFMWDAYYLYDEALKRFSIHDVSQLGSLTLPEMIIDPEYIIDINRQPGYHITKVYRYFSRLDGTTTHEFYVLKRN